MTNPQKPESITVFFPVFNDQGTIESLAQKALAVLPALTDDFEVLLINDGSTDASASVADELARNLEHVRVIHHSGNQGYGAALRTGFSNASKELIFYTDGDGQYDVSELALLVPLMSDGVDVVNGYKIKRQDNRGRKASGALYNRLAHFIFRLPIRDVDCDFRLVRHSAIDRISLELSSGAICVELVSKLSSAGCTFREVPVHHYPRSHGKSQFFTPRRVARTLFDFFALWLNLVLPRLLMFGSPQLSGDSSGQSRSLVDNAPVRSDGETRKVSELHKSPKGRSSTLPKDAAASVLPIAKS